MSDPIIAAVISVSVLVVGWLINRGIQFYRSRYQQGKQDAGWEARLGAVETACKPLPSFMSTVTAEVGAIKMTINNGLTHRITGLEKEMKTIKNGQRRQFATIRREQKETEKRLAVQIAEAYNNAYRNHQ